MKLPLPSAAGCALAALLTFAGTAQAAPLYSNFDPAAATADYQTTQYADLSGSCNSAYCHWINAYSASFDFTAAVSGKLSRAFLPMEATFTVAGAERIYGLTITDDEGKVVARGGFYGRDAPIGTMQIYEIDLFASLHAGQPVPGGVLADVPLELVAGETYTVHFAQTFGSMSGARWMKSHDAPAPGQARVHCQTNAGGYCAYWDWGLNGWAYPLGQSFTAPMTDWLPALHLDGQVTSVVPEPGTAPLLLAGVLAVWLAGRLRAGTPGARR